MQVGAIGSVMTTPYIYNTNRLDRASMNKVPAIEDDLLSAKTDFSDLAQENTNPLAIGETKDFAGILEMQLSMGAQNAARLGLE